jgi:alpha-N-arabinofuranosidase
MYVPFQDATSLPVPGENNPAYKLGGKSIPGISASAARGKDGKLYLALVNTNPPRRRVCAEYSGQAIRSRQGPRADRRCDGCAQHLQVAAGESSRRRSAPAAGGKLTVKVPAKAVIVVAVEG